MQNGAETPDTAEAGDPGGSTAPAAETATDISPPPRGTAERRRHTLDRLAAERDIWLATAHPEHGPHLVPLWFVWDGEAVWVCTGTASATVRNIRADHRVRLSLPDTADVALLQGRAECFAAEDVPSAPADLFTTKFGWDPRQDDAPHTYVRVRPRVLRAWHSVSELQDRVILRNGAWL